MKQILSFKHGYGFFLLVFIFLGMGGMSWADIIIVGGGKPKATIYVAKEVMLSSKKEDKRIKESVEDLAKYLEKISGAKLDIITEKPKSDDEYLPLLVGDLATKVFGLPEKRSPYKQGWRLVISKKGIGFIGESGEAVSYAIYELLDRLGCRWYMPSEMGEVIPKMDTISLPEMDISEVPATISRDIWYCTEDFKRRNRLGGLKVETGHALETSEYISKKQLEEYPEWYGEVNGKRSADGGLCWGNPEVAETLADGIIKKLDQGYCDSISLSPRDSIFFCECEKCKALDAGDWDKSMGRVSISDRFIHFCNQVVSRVTEKYPDVLFGALAYVQYTRPPVGEKPHPNLVTQIAPITYCRAHSMSNPNCLSRQDLCKIVEDWGKTGAILSFYEYGYNLAEVSAPNPMITKWSEDLPFLYANNIKLWSPETMPNFESVLPGLYLGIRMSWYTQADPKDILEEFFNLFYGSAAEQMKEYWYIIDDAWTKVPEHTGCGFGYSQRFTLEVLKKARAAMDRALLACKTDMEKQRVEFANESLRQFELFMKMRRDLFAARFKNLGEDANLWLKTHSSLEQKYKKQYAFTLLGDSSYARQYFEWFFNKAYQDASRIAKDFEIISQPIRNWRYKQDKDKKGESLGWNKSNFNDKDWKITDSCMETWSALGLWDYYGPVWYRTQIKLLRLPKEKKVYLWVSSTDGTCKVFVNGLHIPFISAKGEKTDEFDDYCIPASFEISSAVKSGEENQITIIGTRTYLNELGTGGLLGPVIIYCEKERR